MSKRLEIMAERSNWGRDIHVAIVHKRNDGKIDIALPLVFETIDENLCINHPTLEFRRDDAQKLMDELWNCGLRPTEGSGSAGSLAATERHLADMQKIAFKLLGDENKFSSML